MLGLPTRFGVIGGMVMNQTSFRNLFACLLTAGFLAACSGSGDRYPSLAVRDVERQQGQFEVTPVAAVRPAELPIESRAPSTTVANLLDRAAGANARFNTKAQSARSLAQIARGSAPSSNAYGNAAIALAELTSLRGETEYALADLDLLLAERSNRLQGSDVANSARAQVLSLIKQQDNTIASLWSLLGQ